MSDEFKPVHGFYLNIANSQGKPTIFVWPVFPEYVTGVQPNAVGGSAVTVKIAEKNPFTVDVVQDKASVERAMRQCRQLDRDAEPPRSSSEQ